MSEDIADHDGIAMTRRDPKDIRYIVVHHSATDEGSVAAFRRYHIEHNKWSDVGYHYVICNGHGGPDGEVQEGRNILFAGAHAIGRNKDSIGICLVGDFTKSKPTIAQMESLHKLLRDLIGKYPIAPERVLGHKEVAATLCPGNIDMEAIRKALKQPSGPTVVVNGIVLPAVMVDGKTYAPVRDLVDALNYHVEWDPSSQRVYVKAGG